MLFCGLLPFFCQASIEMAPEKIPLPGCGSG